VGNGAVAYLKFPVIIVLMRKEAGYRFKYHISMADGSMLDTESLDTLLADMTFHFTGRLWYERANVTSSSGCTLFETDRRMPSEVISGNGRYSIIQI